MLVRSVLIATLTLATPTLAAEQMAKSGSFITASGFKGIEQAQQTGGRTLSHGVVYGIVTEDNRDVPLFVEHCEAVATRLMLSCVGLASKHAAG